MVDDMFSIDSEKIASEATKKDKKEEIRRDEHIRNILRASKKLPMKIIITQEDINEFFED
jgi:hypothetical protein